MIYMKRLFILIAVVFLSGCAHTQPPPPVKPVEPETKTGPLTLAELEELEQAYRVEVETMTVPELCEEYRSQGSTRYRARFRQVISDEFRKRNAWSELEWGLIKRRKIAVGVSERLVRCSWGDPLSIDTKRTSQVVYKKLVYGDGDVYINNGVVTTILSSASSY